MRELDHRQIGKEGERLTEKKLKWFRLFGHWGKLSTNVYVPKKDGQTTEIDAIYLTRKGIFVIESKNYSGWIYGDAHAPDWVATLPHGIKNVLYNPIWQNQGHIKWLRRCLRQKAQALDIDLDGVPYFSVIVFSERCTLKKISLEGRDVCVVKRNRLNAALRKIWKKHKNVLTKKEVRRLHRAIRPLAHASWITKVAHRAQGVR